MEEFNQETKKILLKLANSLDKSIAGKAYYKLAEVEMSLALVEENKKPLDKIEIYLAKSLLLGYQPSLKMLNQYFSQFATKYTLIQNFIENIEKIDYLLVIPKNNVGNDFKFLEKIILDCKRQLPIAVLRLGYFYSHPEFPFYNPSAAYVHLEFASQDPSLTGVLNELISHYRKEPSFAGAKNYADFLEKRLSPHKEKNSSSLTPWANLLIQKLSSSEVLVNLDQLTMDESVGDMNQIFLEINNFLKKLKQDLSDLAIEKALLTSQKAILDGNDNSLLEYNRTALELSCVNILSKQLSEYQSKIKSKEQLINYLNEFQTKLTNFSPEKSLSRLQNDIGKIIEGIKSGSLENSSIPSLIS